MCVCVSQKSASGTSSANESDTELLSDGDETTDTDGNEVQENKL